MRKRPAIFRGPGPADQVDLPPSKAVLPKPPNWCGVYVCEAASCEQGPRATFAALLLRLLALPTPERFCHHLVRGIRANFLYGAGLNKTVPDRIIALRPIDDAGFEHFLNLGGAELEGRNKADARFDRR
jgi:hypothetical protein